MRNPIKITAGFDKSARLKSDWAKELHVTPVAMVTLRR
jgi:hypothetical protein